MSPRVRPLRLERRPNRTVTVDMVEVDGRWLVDGWVSQFGPTPAAPAEAPIDAAGPVAVVLGEEDLSLPPSSEGSQNVIVPDRSDARLLAVLSESVFHRSEEMRDDVGKVVRGGIANRVWDINRAGARLYDRLDDLAEEG